MGYRSGRSAVAALAGDQPFLLGDGREWKLGPRSEVADHLGGRETAEPSAIDELQIARVAIEETRGVEIAGARGVDHLLDACRTHLHGLLRRDDHRPGFRS